MRAILALLALLLVFIIYLVRIKKAKSSLVKIAEDRIKPGVAYIYDAKGDLIGEIVPSKNITYQEEMRVYSLPKGADHFSWMPNGWSHIAILKDGRIVENMLAFSKVDSAPLKGDSIQWFRDVNSIVNFKQIVLANLQADLQTNVFVFFADGSYKSFPADKPFLIPPNAAALVGNGYRHFNKYTITFANGSKKTQGPASFILEDLRFLPSRPASLEWVS